MKHVTPKLLLAALLLAGANQAFAQSTLTTAGTPVSNTAKVSYQVNGISQTDEDSNTATFVVDRKIDVVVARVGSYASATPGAPATLVGGGSALPFTVTNATNDVMDIQLVAANMAKDDLATPTPEDDDGNVSGFLYYQDKTLADGGTTVGTWGADDVALPTSGTANYLDNVAAGNTITVFIVAAIPGTLVNDDVLGVSLTATMRKPNVVGAMGVVPTPTTDTDADDIASVDDVFADGAGGVSDVNDIARDGKHSAAGAYQISSADITVSKTSFILSDGLVIDGVAGGDTTNPKAVPGATILYCITVANNGTKTATSITLSDTVVGANATYKDGTVRVDITQAIPVCDSTTLGVTYATTLLSKGDADFATDGDIVTVVKGSTDPADVDTPANDDVVTVSLPDLGASGAATVVFEATID
jgi:uncharacterized repeat protein (TIGR01451 family)